MENLFLNIKNNDTIEDALGKSREGRYIEAIELLERHIRDINRSKKPRLFARVALELGDCYQNLPESDQLVNNLNKAIDNYSMALDYYTKNNDPYAYAYISNRMGRIKNFLFENSNDREEIQSAIDHYKKAIDIYQNSIEFFTTIYEYKTEKTTSLNKEEYSYFFALIHYNLSIALKNQANLTNSSRREYIDSLNTSIDAFRKVMKTSRLHQSDYLNAGYYIGACYELLSAEVDEEENLKKAMKAYRSISDYFLSNKNFNEMYPNYYRMLVEHMNDIRRKLGTDDIHGDHEKYEIIQYDNEEVCKNCGNANVVKGHTIPLCQSCRDAYTRLRIPAWIKLFAGAVLVVFILALFKFPGSLNAGINFERGMRADKELKCETALKYLTKALKAYPDSFLLNSRVFIDYAKCGNYTMASNIYKAEIAGKQTDNDDLYKEIEQMYKKVFMPDDNYKELQQILAASSKGSLSKFIEKINDYNVKYPNNVEGLVILSNIYFNQNKFKESRDLDIKALTLQPERDDIRLELAAAYRQTGELDESLKECEYILSNVNSENSVAIGSISRLFIKKHQFAKALEYANRAYELDNGSQYNLETIAMAYHFNKMIEKRDEAYQKIKGMNYDENTKKDDLKFLNDVFSGKSKLYY